MSELRLQITSSLKSGRSRGNVSQERRELEKFIAPPANF
jgi:hypothetical protein